MIDDVVFIKGLELSRLFYEEIVAPLLQEHCPELRYSAGQFGHGSDALGFDTAQSRDHDWGPRLMLFLAPDDVAEEKHKAIDTMLGQELPFDFRGYPIDFYFQGDAWDGRFPDSRPVRHAIKFHTTQKYFPYHLNTDPSQPLSLLDWLTIPQQVLRSMTSGAVFYDGLGELKPIRANLSYYPHDVWLYLMSAQWRRIAQEESFMGRCGQVGDELGSRLVASRLVRDLMNVCFLQERCYAPYIKWLGTAFQQLSCAATLTPIFLQIQTARSWQEREAHLTTAYEFIAQKHNDLALTPEIPTKVSAFHERPFLIIHAGRFERALMEAIKDPAVLELPSFLGGIDQFIDTTDVLSYSKRFAHVKSLYEVMRGT